MPKKIRELVQSLRSASFEEVGGGKGSHRKFLHPNYAGAVTISGNPGDDARPYQEKMVKKAIAEVTNESE